MKSRRSSSLLIAFCLGLTACAETRVTDHVAVPADPPLSVGRQGNVLLVVETALPDDGPDRDARSDEAARLVRQSLESVTGRVSGMAGEERLLALARSDGLESVMVVRVDDYARRGVLHIGVSLPPLTWETSTVVSLRLRVIDVRTGAIVADVRRDRVRGGLFTRRTAEDLPDELKEALRSLVLTG